MPGMAKTKGAKSSDHAEKRANLLRRFRERLTARNLPPPSLRELAAEAGVTVPTVRHYFGRRDDLIVAVMEDFRIVGEPHLVQARLADWPFAESIDMLVRAIAVGLAMGVSELHAMGLREGLRHDRLGPAYLLQILEPTILAIEARLRQHQDRAEMRPGDTRTAAIGLLSPLVIAHFHQQELGGTQTRPLDRDAFLAEHIDAFVRAYRA